SGGSHNIQATYDGDGNFNGSTSPILTQSVMVSGKQATVTALTSSANPSVFGQPVTFTATVTAASGTGTPTGFVTFTIDSKLQVVTVALSNGQASVTVTKLKAGKHMVVAVYSGDTSFNPSTSPTLVQTVNKAKTDINVDESLVSTSSGNALLLSASVDAEAPSLGTPTGTVTFFIDGVAQGTVRLTNGKASLTKRGLRLGHHIITVVYHGDADYLASHTSEMIELRHSGGCD